MSKNVLNKNSLIYVAGHRGLVGSAITRVLMANGYQNLLLLSRSELDLLNQGAVDKMFQVKKPDFMIIAAARVGGIHANNSYPANFIYENIVIETNLIHSAYKTGMKHMIFLGSSCIYPRDCPQPMKEEYLLTGPLEKTNESYAIAKIAGIKVCVAYNRQYDTNYISLMPTNLYGPGDNYDLQNSHVLPAMIRKFIEAKQNKSKSVTLWGTGNPRREFLYVDDLADACLFFMNNLELFSKGQSLYNVGWGKDISISELANLICELAGFQGEIIWDKSMPDGTPQKLLETSRLSKLGWNPGIDLKEGISRTIDQFILDQEKKLLRQV